MNRLCLFAGYNYNNILSQYVIDYIKELHNFSEIFYLADGQLPDSELKKIERYVKKSWVIDHGGYDFFSWKLLIEEKLGWGTINNYDEIILANDSCFCVNSFKPVFENMEKTDIDFWGLLSADNKNITEFSTFDDYINLNQKEFYIGSFFLGLRKKFFSSFQFFNFVNNIKKETNRKDVYYKYELGLFNIALSNNFKVSCWNKQVYRYSTPYMRDAFNLIKNGFPLLKVRIFIDNIGGQTLMNEIASVTYKFCEIDYRKYINQVRKERNLPAINFKEKKVSIKNKATNYSILINILPPFFVNFFKEKQYKIIQKILINITPPIIFDFIYFIKFYKSINNSNQLNFSFIKRPPYKAWYPCQIKNYEKNQLELVKEIKDAKKIIVFFNVMRESISGGMLSIDRFVQKSLPIAKQYNFNIVLSNIPLKAACINNPYYSHSIPPLDFRYLCCFSHPDKLQLNIPENFVKIFLNEITAEMYTFLFSIKDLRINILNQNEKLMPPQDNIERLRTLCNNKLTITAAHQRYATTEKSKQYKTPVYLLKPFLPKFYRKSFKEKKKNIIFSPDNNIYKNLLLSKLKKELPDYKIITVKNFTFEQYKHLISTSLFTISFGEGWDGYFIEPYRSSSISFTVYNSTFFPKEFNLNDTKTVYKTWDELLNNIIKDILLLSADEDYYQKTSMLVENEINKFSNDEISNLTLKEFYSRFLDDHFFKPTLSR